MTLEMQAVAIAQLALATALSGIVGMDRERHEKAAGLRTHMLSGIGACLFTILSVHAFPGADTSRVAASVVTGIGFIGAGVVLKRGGTVHELTTAASIWVTAAIGMAVGAGAWLLATAVTVIVWLVLAVLRYVKPAIQDSGLSNRSAADDRS
jgi:putative Mg2+ transporter-C (MgtC) family protein